MIPVTTQFDLQEVSDINDVGDNVINGQAFLRQKGSGFIICSGFEIDLVSIGCLLQGKISFNLRFNGKRRAGAIEK